MKRFLSLILVLSLALSLIALPAMAEGEAFTIAVNLGSVQNKDFVIE